MERKGLRYIGKDLIARVILEPGESNLTATDKDGNPLDLTTKPLDDGRTYYSAVVNNEIAPITFAATDENGETVSTQYSAQEVTSFSNPVYREPKND